MWSMEHTATRAEADHTCAPVRAATKHRGNRSGHQPGQPSLDNGQGAGVKPRSSPGNSSIARPPDPVNERQRNRRSYTFVMSWLALVGLVLLGIAVAVILAGALAYCHARRRGDSPREAAAWLREQGSDLVRIPGRLRRLAADPRVPRRARWLLIALAAYLVTPIDLIPDFIPVIGQLDDVAVAGLLLWLARRAVPAEVWREYFPSRSVPPHDSGGAQSDPTAPPASDQARPTPPAPSPDQP